MSKKQIPIIRNSEKITPETFNRIIKGVNQRSSLISGKDINVKETPNGWIIDYVGKRGASGIDANAYVVQTVSNNWLGCRLMTSFTEYSMAVMYYIAKPQCLRHNISYYANTSGVGTLSIVSSNNQRMTVTNGTKTETWEVTPYYKVNYSIIWAIPVSFTGVQDTNGEEITLLDLNVDGRAWAVLP